MAETEVPPVLTEAPVGPGLVAEAVQLTIGTYYTCVKTPSWILFGQ